MGGFAGDQLYILICRVIVEALNDSVVTQYVLMQ